jgi:hypothetical protein
MGLGMSDESLPLSTVVYRSRAVQPLSAPDLRRLTQQAQARNRTESITGVVVYDHETFFQWLEGPAANLSRIMGSIRNDPRHTDIEILDDQTAGARRFGDWDLKLAARLPKAALWQREVIEPPIQIIEELHRHPDVAPVLLTKLSPACGFDDAPAARGVPRQRGVETMLRNTVLEDVIRSAVIPELAGELGIGVGKAQAWPSHARAPELARLLAGADPQAAIELIRLLLAEEGSIRPLYASLFEPAARGLGDLWSDDLCSEVEVTLGLCRLQSAIRLVGDGMLDPSAVQLPLRSVLVAPEPGEPHMLGAALDSDMLTDAGWAPECAFPADDGALQALLAASWFDALDLTLSTAFQREHWLPRMTRTIVLAREASRNPALVVVVGGRVFVEQRDAGRRVGADAASTTALEIEQLILNGLPRTPKVQRR